MGIRWEWVHGSNRAQLEEPELLLVRLSGPIDLPEAKALISLYQRAGSEQPVFAIINISNSSATPEMRRYFMRELRPEWFRALIYVGTKQQEIAVGRALAAGLTVTGRWKSDMLYFDTEEEARAAVARLREKQHAPPG